MIKLDNVYPQYITDEKGKKKSVILSISKYQELIEDIEDLAAVAERRDEPTISHKRFLAELKNDGLIRAGGNNRLPGPFPAGASGDAWQAFYHL